MRPTHRDDSTRKSADRAFEIELAAASGRATIDPRTWTVTLVRAFPLSPDDVWPWLVEPRKLREWSPIVPDGPLTAPGAHVSHETPDSPGVPADVLEAVPGHLLRHRWGGMELTWTLAGLDRKEAHLATSATTLTLRNTASSRDEATSLAAGWDICLAVLASRIRGSDTPRIVGERALAHGWKELRERYEREV